MRPQDLLAEVIAVYLFEGYQVRSIRTGRVVIHLSDLWHCTHAAVGSAGGPCRSVLPEGDQVRSPRTSQSVVLLSDLQHCTHAAQDLLADLVLVYLQEGDHSQSAMGPEGLVR